MKCISVSFVLRLGACLLFCAAGPSASRAQDPAPAENRAGGEAREHDHEHSPVAEQMSAMNRNLRKLSRQYADPAQKASSQQIVAELIKNAEATKTLTPPKAAKLSDAEKAKYLELYNKDTEALLKEFTALKDAVDAGDNDKVKAELDQLNKLKQSSHKELGVQMRGGPGGPGGGRGPARGETGAPPAPESAPGASKASPALETGAGAAASSPAATTESKQP